MKKSKLVLGLQVFVTLLVIASLDVILTLLALHLYNNF